MAVDYVEADSGSGGAKFATYQYTVGANGVDFPVMILGKFIDESTVPTEVSDTNPLPADVRELAGNTISVGAGTVGTGVQRTTLASDDPAVTALQVIDDWDESDRAKVNIVAGQAGITAGAGAVGASTPRVTLASDDPAVAALTGVLSVDDNSGSLTVDNGGTFAVQVDAALPAGTNNIGDVDVASVVPGTGATNLGKAIDSVAGSTDTGIAALGIRDDVLSALTPVEGDWVPLRVSGTGALHVTSLGSDYTEGATDATITGKAIMMEGAGNILYPAQGDSTDGLLVNLGLNNDVKASGVDAENAAVTGNPVLVGGRYDSTPRTLGNGDAGAIALDPDGAVHISDGGNAITVDGTLNTLATAQGDTAHDSADSGPPVKIGAKAETSLAGITLVADADRTDLHAGVDGVLITRNHCNLEDIVSGNANNTDGSSTEVIAAAGAGIKQYLTNCTLTNTSSTDTYCEIKSGTTVRWTFPVPANGGVTHKWDPPLPPNAANEAWNFDMGAAVSTAYCSLAGFQSKV